MVDPQAIGRSFRQLIFPELCLGCNSAGAIVADGLCSPCAGLLADIIRQDYCGRCGSSVGPYGGRLPTCPRCGTVPTPLGGVVRMGAHKGLLRDLLLAYKYTDRDDLEQFFGAWLGHTLSEASWFDTVEAIVAVPTHWRRHLLGRPYIATAIAEHGARIARLPDLPLLRRTRGGRSQIGLSHAQRVENVKGAFVLSSGVELEKATICLVDDVATTGATLFECARVLKRAGAAKVYAAVVCKLDTR